MRKKVIIGAMFGGVVLLLWQFAVHELLGIYDDAFVKLKDPAAVEAVLKENLTGSGMFVIPHPEPGDTDAEAKAMEKTNHRLQSVRRGELCREEQLWHCARYSVLRSTCSPRRC